MSALVDSARSHLPLWAIGIILLLIFLVSCELGLLVTHRIYERRKIAERDRGSLGYIVTAIFALLTFMLATTFSIALSRFDARRMAMANEVDAIGTG